MVCPLHELCKVALHSVVQGGHAGNELRHDHHDQRVDQQQTKQDGECYGQNVDEPFHLFRDEPAQKAFNGVAHRLEQVCDDGTVDEGHQDACQRRDSVAEAVKAVDQEEKDDAQGDRSEPGQHRVQIGFDVRFFVHHDKLHSCRGKQESPRH